MLWSPFDDLEGFIPSSNLNSRDSSHWRDCEGKAGASGPILKARRRVARQQIIKFRPSERKFSRAVAKERSNRCDF